MILVPPRVTALLRAAGDTCLTLHNMVFLVLLLEALNSFRNFGLRFMQYNFVTDEYGLSDTEAGGLLGAKAAKNAGKHCVQMSATKRGESIR